MGAGVIDADYRGSVGVILFNHSENNFESEYSSTYISHVIDSMTILFMITCCVQLQSLTIADVDDPNCCFDS